VNVHHPMRLSSGPKVCFSRPTVLGAFGQAPRTLVTRCARRAPAALNLPNEIDTKTPARSIGPRASGAFAVAASLLTLASSEASAWVCVAAGLGSSGYARAYDIIDAKLFALRRCERRSPLPVCTLVWCRPGG
jgi:hypothetical protein